MKTKILLTIICLLIGNTLLGQKLKEAKEYDPDGFLRVEYQHLEKDPNSLQGFYKEYYAEKKKRLKIEGQYDKKQKTGLWKYYDRRGDLLKEITWEKDIKEGKYCLYYSDNQKEQEGNYANDKKVDLWRYYNAVGTLNCEGNYEDNQKEGQWKFYYASTESKQAVIQAKASFEKGLIQDTAVYYYSNGDISAKIFFKDNVKRDVNAYYESGAISIEKKYEGADLVELKRYYEDGQVKIHLTKDRAQHFYENGKLRKETVYKQDTMIVSHTQFDEKGKALDMGTYKDGTGQLHFYNYDEQLIRKVEYKEYMKNGIYRTYNDEGMVHLKGTYANNVKVGTWEEKKGNDEWKEIVQDGTERITDTGFGPSGDVFVIVETMPEFPGGQKEMLKFIYTNVQYPAIAKANNIEGRVIISFIVDELGFVQKAKVVRDVGGGCGDESLGVVNKMPRWDFGVQRGEPVKVQYNLPVMFKLE